MLFNLCRESRWYLPTLARSRHGFVICVSTIKQDHRGVKRVVRTMLGVKSFWAARCTLAGIEVMPAIRKGQLVTSSAKSETPAEQFYALAA